MATIAEQLREMRKAQGMTLQDLAEKAGSTTKSISQIETGKQDMTVTFANRLLGALGYELSVKSLDEC